MSKKKEDERALMPHLRPWVEQAFMPATVGKYPALAAEVHFLS
jgi:hypothetical protein